MYILMQVISEKTHYNFNKQNAHGRAGDFGGSKRLRRFECRVAKYIEAAGALNNELDQSALSVAVQLGIPGGCAAVYLDMDKIIFKLSTKILLAITIPCLFFISGCASYTENGELVRHHFGYVKVITPAVHAPESAVRSLEVETYGIWVNMDNRSDPENIGGFGTGLGYKYDRRDFIPLDCRVVIRVKTIEEFKKILKELQTSENQEGGICIIRD